MEDRISALVAELLGMEGYTLILGRHGKKSIDEATRNGELTIKGRLQMATSTYKLISEVGLEALMDAGYMCSPVKRVRQSAHVIQAIVFAEMIGSFQSQVLEWGPDDGDNKNATALDLLMEPWRNHGIKTVVAIGHNGLWQQIAQDVCPREGGYEMDEAEFYVIRIKNGKASLTIISPNEIA